MSNHENEREVAAMDVDSSTVAILNKAEIDVQIATAHKYKRSIKKFRDDTLQMVTLNENVADSCIYALPRAGKVIEGPSARFAEVIASAWGNCRAGARVISDQGDFITAQGVFHDLERNVAITYEVQRRIIDKNGKRFKADMIGVTGNAASSIALRNAILKGIPKAFWDDMYQAARKTVMGNFQTLANRRAEAMKAFVALGVTEDQVLAKLEVSGIEDIGLEHLVILRGLITAIKEGDTTPEQAFAVDGAPIKKTVSKPKEISVCTAEQFEKELPNWRKVIESNKKTAEQIISMTATRFTLTDEQKATLSAPAPKTASPEGGVSFAEVAKAMSDAQSVNELDDAADFIGEVADGNQREQLMAAYKTAKAKFD